MHRAIRSLVLGVSATAALALPLSASAQVGEPFSSFTMTGNLQPLGFSARAVPLTGTGSGIVNSDLAFWGDRAFQGTYEGFRIVDISQPDNPTQLVNFADCVGGTTNGAQGDVIVFSNILVRSWNSSAGAGGRLCGGLQTPQGQRGLHIFDVGDPTRPRGIAFVPTPCGSHTATGVPDLANGRLLVYNNPSSTAAGCRGIEIVEIPLANPASASFLRLEPSGDPVGLPNLVTIDAGSSAAGKYEAAGAAFGPAPTAEGFSGPLALGNDGAGLSPTDGCEPYTVPAGAIAVVDRGNCDFNVKVFNGQTGGAGAVIVVNNVAGTPGAMGGTNAAVTIPAVQVSLADGTAIKGGLPATGRVSTNPPPPIPERGCHDTAVILDNVMRAACAGGNGITVWSLDPADGGSLTDPKVLYSRSFPGVTIGHAASFTWDGKYLVFGHEPGGGSQARCQATSTDVDRTLFFLDSATGNTVGTLIHPRPQTSTENCTWHNFNVVPTNDRYVLVSSAYQAGTSVVDFTDPANPREIASADPAPLDATTLIGGGDWSTYWYDGFVYSSDMKRGMMVWRLADPAVAGARAESHSNPQTQYTSLAGPPAEGDVGGSVPATLSLSVGSPANLGAFTPGVARDYFASTSANVISTAGDAVLSVADPSSTATGRLVNGAFALPQPLQARARNAANTGTAYNNVGSSASPLNLLAYGGPISNDAVSLEFKQSIGANDALRTGAYSKTLTFTLSTTTP
jgi:hypothetical protein